VTIAAMTEVYPAPELVLRAPATANQRLADGPVQVRVELCPQLFDERRVR